MAQNLEQVARTATGELCDDKNGSFPPWPFLPQKLPFLHAWGLCVVQFGLTG